MKAILDLSRFKKQLLAACIDFCMLPLTFFFSIWLRYDHVDFSVVQHYWWLLLAAPLVSIPIFIRIGLYRAMIRFIDQKIVYVVVLGVSLSVLVLVTLSAFSVRMSALSRSVFAIYWISAILYMVAGRFIARGYFLRAMGPVGATRVAIYGAGDAGIQLASALRVTLDYALVAFIDDSREMRGATIAGTKVYRPDDLEWLVARRGIKEVLLAMPTLTRSQQKRILNRLEPLQVKTRVTPPMGSLLNGQLRLQDVRDIEIEDLLGRDPVAPDMNLISSCITDKAVLISGAGGSIGSELCRQIVRLKPARMLLLESSEYALYAIEQELRALCAETRAEVELLPFLGSVLDQEKCLRMLQTYAVDTVYHAAAYKHVPLVEHNPIEGIRNNVFGTLSLARAAMDAKVRRFVLISTDKAVRPTNVMGCTKRLAELILQAFAREQKHTRFCMVRFGNVLGSSGSVVPLFRNQIMAGGPITVTHPEITRYFMTISEAAQLVLQAGAMGEGGDVFVLDMGEPVRIMDLAKRMVHLSGLEVKSEATPHGTIEIRQIGLRPGEKLYEELLIGANAQGTEHPLILRAQEAELPWSALSEALNRLAQASERFAMDEVRELLLQTVVEYAPQCGIEDFLWTAAGQHVGRTGAVVRPLRPDHAARG
ncbi:polysaccharide biosynthesis protein [Noviherbaspirillum pedocola]|uniref:Polysaccharide biosynthesis protein n=1 Tax=Noviherbaspirillum pedocola TaxID=2801341 RepID=A0A934W5L6_9BURK|nr:nucleoside-diphosphate sugar epimerase/dehydratase [Noviherbaspirillum pedocola]MBK4733363.1 polysaccharide biosynthesis protein [Noviherbaspirillum pedocola]